MKKLLYLVFSVLFILGMMPFSAFAYSDTGTPSLKASTPIRHTSGNYTYTVTNGAATITDYNQTAYGTVNIPSTLGGYPVTTIDAYAFMDCIGIKAVTIPDCVTTIGRLAFKGCEQLITVKTGNGITEIPEFCFNDCHSIEEVTIGNNVTTIGKCAFDCCFALKDIYFGKKVKYIKESAFDYCRELETLMLPDTVEVIENSAFDNCSKLTAIYLGKGIQKVDSPFYNCDNLTDVYYPLSESDWKYVNIVEGYGTFGRNVVFHFNWSTVPTASISSTNNVASSQTVTLTVGDDLELAGYYWGTNASTEPEFTAISGKSFTTTKTVSDKGTYYLTVIDKYGYTYQVSRTFYKTKLNANGGSVSTSDIITMSGNSFNFPTPTQGAGEYIGWATSSSATSGVKKLKPSENTTYYAIWKVLSSISIASNPTKTDYIVGESLDTSGLRIKLTYSDGTTSTVSSGFTTSGFSSSSAGAKTVTVTYEGKQTHFSVNVEKAHVHSLVRTARVEAKCTEDGNIEYWYCSSCGKYFSNSGATREITLKDTVLPKFNHKFVTYVSNNDATCKQDGTKTATCERCTATHTVADTGTRKSHTPGSWIIIKKPTLTENGLRSKYCEICGTELQTESIPALKPENPFIDIPAVSWYTDACLWCNANSYITGTSATTFNPGGQLTRAMFVQIIAKVDGVDISGITYGGKFTDVKANQWFAKAVQWAVDCGVTGGTGNGKFSPNNAVTREQLASFFMAYSKYKKYDTSASTSLAGYKDASTISGWAKNAMQWAVAEGLISGTSATTVSPQTSATRAQAAVIFKSFVENYVAKQK